MLKRVTKILLILSSSLAFLNVAIALNGQCFTSNKMPDVCLGDPIAKHKNHYVQIENSDYYSKRIKLDGVHGVEQLTLKEGKIYIMTRIYFDPHQSLAQNIIQQYKHAYPDYRDNSINPHVLTNAGQEAERLIAAGLGEYRYYLSEDDHSISIKWAQGIGALNRTNLEITKIGKF